MCRSAKFFYLILNVFLLPNHSDARQSPIERFTKKDGLVQNVIRTGTRVQAFMLALLFVSGLTGDAYAQRPRFERFSIREGLVQRTVTHVIQDRLGFLWLSTRDGLLRYDGYHFKEFRSDPNRKDSLSSNLVYYIFEDRRGNIWVGTTGGGLNKFDPNTETFVRYQHDPENSDSLSHNNVLVILEDSKERLWIGTEGGGLNRMDPETGTFTRYRHNPVDPNSLSFDTIWHLYEDREGYIWIGTYGGGLDRMDPESKTFKHYRHDPDDPHSLASDTVGAIYEDRQGNLWVGGKGGLNKLDRETGKVKRYAHDPKDLNSLSTNHVWDIIEGHDGVLWLGTFGGGLVKLDPKTDQIMRYTHNPNDSNSLGSDLIWCLFEDREGILWIGTDGSGLNKFVTRTEAFGHYKKDPGKPVSLAHNSIHSVYDDRNGILWLGNNVGGFQKFDPKTGTATLYTHDPDNPNSLNSNMTNCLTVDRSGMVWIGTYGGGVNRFDPQTEIFTHYLHAPDDPNTLSDDRVWTLYEDRAGDLWVGTLGGLNRMNPQRTRVERFLYDPQDPNSISDDGIWTIYEDQAGNLWVGTYNGLNKRAPRSNRFQRYFHDPEDPNSLTHNTITSLFEDSEGNLWVGTTGGLNKMDPQAETFIRYTDKDGLASSYIQGVLEDDVGNLWIATQNGLSRFDPDTGAFRNYDVRDGLQGNKFSRAFYKTHDGKLVFGGENGINVFAPSSIRDNAYIPPVVLTDFQLFNNPVPIGGDSVLQKPIGAVDALTLSYKESVFSFEFAALSYTVSEKNRYRYKMQGFERDWNEVGSDRRFATYTSLPPGNYVFRVLGSNNDGDWNEEGVSLNITITPPWWKTWWFRGLAVLAAVGLIAGAFVGQRRSAKRRERILETQVVERTHELAESNEQLGFAKDQAETARKRAEAANQAKSKFLANMSHELRTPLNSILGYSQLLERNPDLPEDQREEVAIINRSGNHLLGLINDILDTTKIETGQVAVNLKSFNLYQFLRGIGEIFQSQCEAHNLRLILEQDPDLPQYIKADEGKLRQVLINLLGNAVKYTEQGTITLRTHVNHQQPDGRQQILHFQVEDTGIGINARHLATIFEPFMQADRTGDKTAGTGLGLAICRQYVQLMGGDISTESTPGSGSIFQFHLPVEISEVSRVKEEKSTRRIIGLAPEQASYRILIVEDQEDSRILLKKLLQTVGFETKEAGNGQEGIQVFDEWQPDFVWMDMRMPVMDGFEATRLIKETDSGKETPVVALTTHAFEEERQNILRAGCDDFVRKPYQESDIFEVMQKHLDVRYIYEDDGKPRKKRTGMPGPISLTTLPGELRSRLNTAVAEIDREAIAECLTEIRVLDQAMADGLAELAAGYRFEEMLTLIQQADKEKHNG